MKLDSNHGSSNGRHCFWCFHNFVKHFVIHIVMFEKMIRREYRGLVKHIYSTQAIYIDPFYKVTRRLKICVSFADKYILRRQICCCFLFSTRGDKITWTFLITRN